MRVAKRAGPWGLDPGRALPRGAAAVTLPAMSSERPSAPPSPSGARRGGAWVIAALLLAAIAFDASVGGLDRGWARPGAFALLGAAAAALTLLVALPLSRLLGRSSEEGRDG